MLRDLLYSATLACKLSCLFSQNGLVFWSSVCVCVCVCVCTHTHTEREREREREKEKEKERERHFYPEHS